VSRALEGEVVSRLEWDACDLRTGSGFKIEVKSAAYVQAGRRRVHRTFG
jgi:hypothetical protein